MSRLYKNGIYGTRYKNYYIKEDISDDGKKSFSVLDKDGNIIKNSVLGIEDGRWEIEKVTAKNQEELKLLYDKSFPELFALYAGLIKDNEYRKLSPKDKELADIITMIKARKKKDLPF